MSETETRPRGSASRDQTLWTARLLAVIAFFSMFANVMLTIALAGLTPLKEVRPFMVSVTGKDDVVATIRPVSREIGGFDTLARALAQEYVVMRHSIVASPVEMERRWGAEDGVVFLKSSLDVYREFLGEATAIYEQVQGSGITVEIDVRAVTTIEPGSKYQVEFDMTTRNRAGDPIMTKSFVSTLDVEFQAVETRAANRLINPTGFTVIGYRTTEKSS